MSIALDIELKRSIPIKHVLPEIGKALREILGLRFNPVVVAEKYVNGGTVLDTDLIEPSSKLIAIKIINEPDVAMINSFTVDFPEEKTYVAIILQPWRTPLAAALVSATAIAFGKYLEETINDSASFYTREPSQTAANLVERLKPDKAFNDYRLAAKEFYSRLPKTME